MAKKKEWPYTRLPVVESTSPFCTTGFDWKKELVSENGFHYIRGRDEWVQDQKFING